MIKPKVINIAQILIFITILFFSSGHSEELQHEIIPKLDCSECHICKNPTFENPCLKACPRLFLAYVTSQHSLTEAPASILMDKLVNQYSAVNFSHKLHAEMAEMNKSCATCHHFIPKDRIPPCSECHGREINPANLRQPSLQGAYHRICLTCHQEWSHDTECRICHIPIEEVKAGETKMGKPDITKTSKPRITEPAKEVYHTSYDEAPVVTFYHDQHVEMFNLRCADCHKNESCSYCHDPQKPPSLAKTPDEMHDICSGCHDIDRCGKCHDTKERPAFSHASTGWPLGKYHSNLKCRSCHPTGKQISRLNTACISCHDDWNQETFKHAVTGLKLDEIHSEMDCGDCHIDRRFERKPDCSVCHDDNRSPKTHPPGAYIRSGSK